VEEGLVGMTDRKGPYSFLGYSGFRNTLLLAALLGFGLVQGGCSGVVSGNSSTGGTTGTTLSISNVSAGGLTATSAMVTWQTNVAATSQIEYGTTTGYGSNTPLDSTMILSHQQSLSGLTAGTLYHYRVHSSDASSNAVVSGDLTFTTASSGGDTTPPVVSITSPAAGATLAGVVNVTASASDPDSPVSFVQFRVDGTNSGAQITSAPYSISLDTSKLSNAVHQLTAVAQDPTGNQGVSAAVSVAVSNAAPVANITGLNPTSGIVGTSVTISGANFGATQGTNTIKFNGITATPTSWSTSSIVAAVPSGATTGNVMVTVGGVSSNGVSFTVSPDTTSPTVSISSPTGGATLSGITTVTANASDNVAVASVQFQLDGANVGALDTTAPYSVSWDTTTATNGSHTLSAIAKDAAGNSATSAAVAVTVSNTASGGMGPLKQSTVNSRYFVDPSGKQVLLSGSQTWNTFQDLADNATPVVLDFTAYVNFLKAHGHNATILWHKDLPTACNWGADGGGTTWHTTPFPWLRTGGSGGTQVASDGLPAFDMTQLDQSYFDRLRARAVQLQQNGIYAIVQMFDGLGLTDYRCSTDGYPFSSGNNVNGISDGGGTGSMSMTGANAITNIQDAYVQKVIDTLNDLPNVLWEPSEEAPDNSTWWQGHMITLIRSYEAGKPLQHPIGYATLNVSSTSDTNLYNSDADWVAPMARISPTSSCGTGTPQCKVNINDSDHSYFGMWNDSAQTNRNFIWENFTRGAGVLFMDPYVIYWPTGNRNLCSSPVHGVCSGPDSRWDNFRNNMGYMLNYANSKLDLLKMTPQGGLSSTGYCLADTVATGAEYLVYAPSGGGFTVNLSVTTQTLNVEWLNPSSGAITTGGTITGGSSSQSFTPPFSGDAVLYLVDAAGHN